MIHLITGKTGNGKSLYAISEIEKRAKLENRLVYYNGIPELKLDWVQFDNARDWATLPSGAIIVIDEARAAFPVRPNGSAVPAYVAAFELHRKQGHDIYILTQQPSFIDSHVRKLTDVHYHLMRKFGKEESVVHKFFTCKEDADKNRTGSITSDFVYPKQNYAVYKSADLHTIKPDVPFRYYLKFILPVVVLLLSVFAYFAFKKASHHAEDTIQTSPAAQTVNVLGNTSRLQSDDEKSPEFYFNQLTPRVPNLALSAPKYDEVTVAKIAPVPSCISSATKCQCYTQQGTKLTTDDVFCRSVADNGYFVDFVNGVPEQAGQQAPAAQPVGIIKGAALDAELQSSTL